MAQPLAQESKAAISVSVKVIFDFKIATLRIYVIKIRAAFFSEVL